jgi:hypothetical protein
MAASKTILSSNFSFLNALLLVFASHFLVVGALVVGALVVGALVVGAVVVGAVVVGAVVVGAVGAVVVGAVGAVVVGALVQGFLHRVVVVHGGGESDGGKSCVAILSAPA